MKHIFLALLILIAKAASSQSIESAFSPDAGAEDLVIKVIENAHSSVRLAAYSFTSAPITAALLKARHRGVDVALVVDAKDNAHSAKSMAALGTLVAAGARVRLNGHYAILHDKFAIIDQTTVETGSFNFTQAAARRNSENVMVVWGDKALAAKYLQHWQSRFDGGIDLNTRF